MLNQISNNKPQSYWTTSDLETLAKTLGVIALGQKAYGKEIIVKDLLAYFKMKLDGRFTVDQVVYALQKYTDTKNDIPSPADVISILNPQKPKVTEAQFVEAQKWQERNGYPMFSDALDTINEYKAQNAEVRQNYQIENQQILALAGSSVKRITA